MELVRHPVWENVFEYETLERFADVFLYKTKLKEEVPDDIKKFAAVTEKILLHSYYEYEFIDIAVTDAVFTFEKALRLRYDEINGGGAKQKSFKWLIDWFYDLHYFETANGRYPHILRQIRNGRVHDTQKSLGGIAFMHTVYNVFDLINDLYEDPQLRIARREVRYDLSEQFSKFVRQGIIYHACDTRLIISDVLAGFVNNKVFPNTLRLFIIPIFDLAKYKGDNPYPAPNFTVKVRDWKFEADIFKAIDVETGENIRLEQIADDANRIRYRSWVADFYSDNNSALRMFTNVDPMGKLFVEELRLLHLDEPGNRSSLPLG